MVFEQKKNGFMVEVYLAVMFLQIQLEIAVIILLPLWESAEASTTYIKASTVLQSSLTVCLNLVSLCWDSSSPSSASSTSTNSLLNLGLPSRAFASLSFLQWRLIFLQWIFINEFLQGNKLFWKVCTCLLHHLQRMENYGQEADHGSYHSHNSLITPSQKCDHKKRRDNFSDHERDLWSRCDHQIFLLGEYRWLKISPKPSTQQQHTNSHNLTSSYKEVKKLWRR